MIATENEDGLGVEVGLGVCDRDGDKGCDVENGATYLSKKHTSNFASDPSPS